MMDIKLIALDMDGTALCSDHMTFSPANRAAVEAAIERGIEVVVATGRLRGRIPEQVAAIEGIRYLITSNGAVVFDRKEQRVLYENPMPRDVAKRVFEALEEFPVYVEAYCDGKAYNDQTRIGYMDRFPMPEWRIAMMKNALYTVDDLPGFCTREDAVVEKIHMPYVPEEYQEAIWSKLRGLSDVTLVSSVPINCEINGLSANKGDGLRHLCEALGILPEQVMVIGDNENDIDMMRYAGLSVAPANSTDEVKALASAVTLADCDHDAVAEALERCLPG